MDAVTPRNQIPPYEDPPQREERFLPAVAEAIKEWFPGLGGRSFAVSDAAINKENVPTLPLVMVALTRSVGDASTKTVSETFQMQDAFIVEFWLEPERYKRDNGTETPFWSYYDYEYVRDRLLKNMVRWVPPNNEIISYRSLNVEADALAVTLTFGFIATFTWCFKDKEKDQGDPFKLGICLKADKSCCIPEEIDPCR